MWIFYDPTCSIVNWPVLSSYLLSSAILLCPLTDWLLNTGFTVNDIFVYTYELNKFENDYASTACTTHAVLPRVVYIV